MNTLLQLAPTILGFLGGPAGGLAGAGIQFLAGRLGAKANTVDAIRDALEAFRPEDQIALRRLDVEFHEFCMRNAIQVQLAQLQVDAAEAASPNWFVAGWRPFVGWTCGLGLLYESILEPAARFVAVTGFNYHGAFPVLDTSLTMQVLLGMLGLVAARSVEKIKDVARG